MQSWLDEQSVQFVFSICASTEAPDNLKGTREYVPTGVDLAFSGASFKGERTSLDCCRRAQTRLWMRIDVVDVLRCMHGA